MACAGCARRREWIKKWMKKAYERATRNRTHRSNEGADVVPDKTN